jgi:lysophospholipase L1-like esterase
MFGIFLLLGWDMALKGRKPPPEASWLALGDSYTIGEAVDPGERYPAQVRRLLAEKENLACGDPEIVAATGWTTGNLLGALSPGRWGGGAGSNGPEPRFDVVSLLIGVNNQFQGRSQAEYALQFEVLLRQSIRLAGGRPGHVVVLSIPDYSVTPFGRTGDTALIAAQIDSFNRINYGLARKYAVNYVDVTAESRRAAADPSLIAGDGLHFSAREYAIWARLVAPVIKEMLK